MNHFLNRALVSSFAHFGMKGMKSLSLFFISVLKKKKGYIFIKNRINMGKVDTRIFATGWKNMVAKGVTHIFLHQLLPHILWKERKEERKGGGGREKKICRFSVF